MSSISSGVPSSSSSGRAHSMPITLIRIPLHSVSITVVPTARLSASRSFAPKYWDTTIVAPVEMPMNSTIIRLSTGPARPTAPSAASPTYRPTTIASTVLYNCCARLPSSRGIENSAMPDMGLPCVRSRGANSFWMVCMKR